MWLRTHQFRQMAMTTGILCFLVVTANCYQENKPVFFVNGRAGAGDPANVNVIKYESQMWCAKPEVAIKAFRRAEGTEFGGWLGCPTGHAPQLVYYHFQHSPKVAMFGFRARAGATLTLPVDFQLVASNDCTDWKTTEWTTLKSIRDGIWSRYHIMNIWTVHYEKQGFYTCYGIRVSKFVGEAGTALQDIKMWTALADCNPNPCKHGTCQEKMHDFTCNCESGWEGKICDHSIDDCAQNPCTNGICQDELNDFTCKCESGWEGKKCDQAITDCDPNPCNQGICQEMLNDFTCTCESGWEGKYCDEGIDDCAPNPCKHGICHDELNDFTCKCDSGWEGKQCDQEIGDCDPNPCEHGTCREVQNHFTCTCESGWEGKQCDQNIDDCTQNPCKHGICHDELNAFTCKCESGWEGKQCDQDIDDCALNPCIHGICQDEFNDFTCNCKFGWNGKQCDQGGIEDIRLVGGNHTAGRVEVLFQGQWGTVCDDKWGMEDARVVCRQLFLGEPIGFTERATFGEGDGPIILDNVACWGDEANINQCRHQGFKNHDCSPDEAAGVICSGREHVAHFQGRGYAMLNNNNFAINNWLIIQLRFIASDLNGVLVAIGNPDPTWCDSDWKASNGKGCQVYESQNYCKKDGNHYGTAWNFGRWGRFENWANAQGKSALSCPQCGCDIQTRPSMVLQIKEGVLRLQLRAKDISSPTMQTDEAIFDKFKIIRNRQYFIEARVNMNELKLIVDGTKMSETLEMDGQKWANGWNRYIEHIHDGQVNLYIGGIPTESIDNWPLDNFDYSSLGGFKGCIKDVMIIQSHLGYLEYSGFTEIARRSTDLVVHDAVVSTAFCGE